MTWLVSGFLSGVIFNETAEIMAQKFSDGLNWQALMSKP
jgi:hypothetical protein